MLKSHETHQNGKWRNGYSSILIWGGKAVDMRIRRGVYTPQRKGS